MNIKIFCRCTCFLPGRAKDLSALLYSKCEMVMGYRHDIPQLIGRTFQTSEVKHIYIYIYNYWSLFLLLKQIQQIIHYLAFRMNTGA